MSTATASSTWHATHDAACDAYISYINSVQPQYRYEKKACYLYTYGGTNKTRVNWDRYHMPANTYYNNNNTTLARRTAANQAQCVIDSTPVTNCAPGAGKYIPLSGTDTSELGKTICVATCEVKVGRIAIKGPSGYTYRGQVSGTNCAAGSTNTRPTDTPASSGNDNNEQCATTTGGQTFCAPHDKENCGWYNDKYTCVNSIPPAGCIKNEAGKLFCDPAASTPPVPNTGTPGVKATPEDVIETAHSNAPAAGAAGSSTTVNNRVTNVYGVGQQTGSSRDTTSGTTGSVGGTVVPGQDGLGGTGEGEGEGESLSNLNGYQECSGGNCPSFDGALSAYVADLYEVPIVAAWTGIGDSVPTGACPQANVTVFGQTYSLTAFACEIWEGTVASLLSLVFLFVWPFIGLRIVMSA